MVDESDNLVLAPLRHMRGVLDRVAEDVAGLKDRVGGLERSVAQIHVTWPNIRSAWIASNID